MFASLSTPWRLLSDRRSIASASRMARERGLTFVSTSADEYVSGRLAGVASLVSGRFAMIENGLGFQLVPWQPLLEKRIGRTSPAYSATMEASSGPWEETEGSACDAARARRDCSHEAALARFLKRASGDEQALPEERCLAAA
jgi:hypothetical protein